MAKEGEGESRDAEQREPFVGGADRPEVRLNPDMPVSELRVRDLRTLLGGNAYLKPKPQISDIKLIKYEKYLKFEKIEKFELPKREKWEYDELPVDLGIPGPDPLQLELLIDAVSQLQQEVAELRKQRGGG